MNKPPRFEHQERERVHRYDVARALLWQMRTGKTRNAVEDACDLHDSLTINGVVVIAPNGVHRQWAEEQIHLWGRGQQSGFAWRYSDPENRKKWELWRLFVHTPILKWLCINMEVLIKEEIQQAISWFKQEVGPAMLIVDESHHFARPRAKRTGVARGLGRMFEYRRILTGTNAENSPFQTFSQFEILERGALGHTTFGGTSKKARGSRHPCPTCGQYCRGFKNEFATWRMGRHGPELDQYQNLDVLKQRMAKYASVVLRSDCEDLPPLMPDHRIVEMEPEQRKWWDTVKNQELEEIEKLGQERVFDGGAALVKLQQIEGGFWLNRDRTVREIVPIKRNPKLLILLDEIQWHDGQVIAWFEYLHEIDAARRFLIGTGIKCGVFSGRNVATRDRDLAAFRRGEVSVLLSQPRAGGEGRDMSVADKIVWFSHTPDAVVRTQANERATKMRAQSIQLVDMITPTGKYFLSITDRKSSIAEDVARRGLKAVISSLEN